VTVLTVEPRILGVVPPAIELVDLRAAYGRIEVLHGIDLVVPPGSIFALLGPNGAGKTTMIKVVDGRLPASSGCVHIGGKHVNDVSADKLALAGVCSIPEGRAVFPNLTVTENLRIAACSRPGLEEDDVTERSFACFPRLAERRHQLAGRLSGGEQQMLAMARAVASDPSLLLVDELSMGLAPKVVDELYDVLVRLADEGMTLFLVEQFARTAMAIADYCAVMSHGKVVAVGEPEDLEDVADAYLGRTT
jgi:branched-chain amino acid transport system ATP-binding protein